MAVVAATTYLYVNESLNQFFVQGSELVDQGAWSSSTTYAVADVAQIGDMLYYALQPNTNAPPTGFVDENWSILVIVEEASVISSGSDWYARYLAAVAIQVGSTALDQANAAFTIAVAGTETANAAYALAQIGTNTGTAAYNLAASAYAIAVAGTSVGTLAQYASQQADAAYALAQIGTNTGTAALAAAAGAQATADAAFSIAVIGTNAAAAAASVASSAWSLAQIGTNIGTAALAAAAAAQNTASSAFSIAVDGTNAAATAQSRANAAYVLAQIGTNTGTAALTAASSAQSRANAAYALAQIGTNTGTAALAAAATAQGRADAAFSIAVIGTNAAAAAASVASSAWTLAQVGTNTGTAALNLASAAQSAANGAFQIAVAGTNAAANAYRLAMVGTNTGTAAYDLAALAYALALSGTAAGTYSGTLAQQALDRANAAYVLAMVGTNTGTAALTAASNAQSTADDAELAASSAQSSANAALILAAEGTVNPPLYALPDVNLPAPSAQQVLTFDGSRWVAASVTAVASPVQFTYYLNDTASGTAGYYTLTAIPTGLPEEVDTVMVSGGTIGIFESYLSGTLNRTLLDAGLWEFNTYAAVSDAAFPAAIVVEIYTRSASGIETYLFSGTTGTIATETPALYTTISAQGTYASALSDKLVAKYYGLRIGTPVNLSLYHDGSEHYSHFHTPFALAHNDLAGLQGGTAGQFYHVTLDQNAALVGTSGQPSVSNPYVTQESLTTEQGTRSSKDQDLQNQLNTVTAVANSAYGIAQIGTNTGTAAYDLAAAAYALASTGTSSGSYSGTLAQLAFDRANAAYVLAQIGTNTGTAALAAAAGAQATADAAFLVAVAGTNAAAAAASVANDAYALAQIGTNTGTAALAAAAGAQATADAAFLVAVAGTNAAAAAASVANDAYALAQIGTNTGTAAFNLASVASSVASSAWQLAQLGTIAPALSELSDVSIPSPNTNDVLTYNGATWIASPSTGGAGASQFGITIDGGGASITSGLKGFVRLPRTFTITGWDLVSDQNGNCVIDVWKAPYASFPPTVSNTITASAKPTLLGAQKATGTVPGWGTVVTAGDYAAFNVDSAASVTRVHLAIYGTT